MLFYPLNMSKPNFMYDSLLQLWAVNVSNKKRDVEFEAKMLLDSREDMPPNLQ